MKKIILGIFMIIFPLLCSAQITEGFEGATFPPTTPGNWITMDNGVGTSVSWAEETLLTRVNTGLKAAIIDRENVGAGATSIDWLVTPQITVGANSQLRFFTRQTLLGNNGSTYEVRVSTNLTQTNQAAFLPVANWTETTLNATYNIYEEKIVSLAAYPAGTQLYIAFIKTNTQPTGTTSGDRWLIDDVKVVQQCLDPTILTVGTITPTTASLGWTNNGTATSWEVEVVPVANIPTGVGVTAPTNPFIATGLTPGTAYKYYVRANCGSGNFSQWVGPFNFLTTPAGSICSVPIVVATLPYSQTSNTNLYGDEVDVTQGASCGAVPAATNYQQGAEVFYSYTPTVSGNITITMTPTGVSSSLFVYNGCGNYPGNCIAGVANAAATPRVVTTLAVTAGQTYIIVISSSTTPAAGIPYTLIIQEVNCLAPAALTAANITTTSADLSWSNPSGATSWQVAIQPSGSGIPTGPGTTVGTNTNYPATGLTAATAYQYWVRADCGGGLFSAWSGPFMFNTTVCNAVDRCNYTFRMTDTFGDGWNGALMQIRQNGVTVATIGSTFTTGAGPVNVVVSLCQTLPFELHWTTPGSFPAEVGVSVINNFGQTLYTYVPGTGSAPSLLYTASFNCAVPACLPPTALTATSITTVGATLGWNGTGATAWNIYVVPTGSPAPTAGTVPTYAGVTVNPFVVTGLLPNTAYQYYISTVCATTNSIWTPAGSFTTLPTCSKPTTQTVTNITQFTATLGWTQPVNPPPGGGFPTTWEVFILPCGSPAPTATSTGAIVTTNNPYNTSGLSPLSCYDFYVRAICSATDSSPWIGPKTFNTPDVNDECTGSKLAPVNQNTNCLQTVAGTVAGATPSSQTNVGTSCNNTADDDDVWFHFVATATTHYISLFNVTGTGTLNYALYTGTVCGSLTQVGPCVIGNNGIANGLVPGQTYRVRIYTSGTTASTKSFELCIGTKIINCPNALPLCAINPIILPNNVGVPSTPNPISPFSPTSSTVGCLGSAPSPTFYYLTIPVSGNYTFFMEQNTNSTFTGTGLDVDYASWGPYPSTTVACATINTSNVRPNPLGCSFSAAFTETITLNGTIAGEVYVIMITNYTTSSAPPGLKGFIRITQTSGPIPASCCPYTNFTYPGAFFCKDGVNPTPSLQPGATAGTYTSTAGLVINSVTGEINLAASTAGTYIITSTIIGAGGCTTATATWNMTISAPASATITYPAPSSYCKSITAVQNVTQTGTTGGTYYATPAGLSINTSTGAITPSTSSVGIYTVNYVITSIPGCPTLTASTTVTITAIPTATIASSDADNTICSNDTATITVTPTNFVVGAATYSWTLNGNPFPGTTNTITPTATGAYVATVTLNGCTNIIPLSLLFTINPQPLATIASSDADNIICANDTATITVTPTNFPVGSATYSWTLNGNPFPGTTNTITPTATGTYEVTVLYNGCSNVFSLLFTINPNPTATIASSDADNTICSNDTATITVTPTNFVVGAATYSWTLNGNPFPGTTNTITPTATGTYVATVTLNGCTTVMPLSLLFTINKLPDFTLTGTNLIKCVNQTSVLTVVPTNFGLTDAGISYAWTFNGAPVSPANNNSSLTVLGGALAYGVYTVTVDNLGCSTTHQIEVTLNTADIPINANGECVGPNYIITALPIANSFNPSPQTVNYEWTNSSGTVVGSNQNTFNVTQYITNNGGIAASFPQTFTVKITTTPEGCTDNQSFVVINPICTIPKGISPNGDGDNDTFDLRGLGVKQLGIFNRYGTKVYSLSNYSNEWKGQSDKGQELPDGTYYYVIDQNNGETKTGWIYLNK